MLAEFLSCQLQTPIHIHPPPPHTHTHTHARARRRNLKYLTRYFDTQHFAVYNTATALSCLLQYPSSRFYIALPPPYSAVLRYQNISVFFKCYIIKHDAFQNRNRPLLEVNSANVWLLYKLKSRVPTDTPSFISLPFPSSAGRLYDMFHFRIQSQFPTTFCPLSFFLPCRPI